MLTKFVAAAEGWRPVVETAGQYFKETDGNVAVLERYRLAEIAASGVDTGSISAKVAGQSLA